MEIKEIKALKSFPSLEGLPRTDEDIKKTLQSSTIKRIHCYTMGPTENNFHQACLLWVKKMELERKTEIKLGETPEKCLGMALSIVGEKDITMFWTCAVFYDLHTLFFTNQTTFPFFVQQSMLLDEMQLVARRDKAEFMKITGCLPDHWKIASHPFLSLLVKHLPCRVSETSSNDYAAQMCAQGKAELCITAEQARKNNDLVKVHSFGSPEIIFFGGITAQGASVVKKAYALEMTSRG